MGLCIIGVFVVILTVLFMPRPYDFEKQIIELRSLPLDYSKEQALAHGAIDADPIYEQQNTSIKDFFINVSLGKADHLLLVSEQDELMLRILNYVPSKNIIQSYGYNPNLQRDTDITMFEPEENYQDANGIRTVFLKVLKNSKQNQNNENNKFEVFKFKIQ